MRLLARQHAFAGYARLEASREDGSGSVAVCTRHHAIDWNFVGAPRSRPNKWRVRPTPPTEAAFPGAAGRCDDWQELSYASDEHSAPYYLERWTRRTGGEGRPSLALRACSAPGGAVGDSAAQQRDAMVVVVGDHFAYVLARPIEVTALTSLGRTLTSVVDEAIECGERHTAEACVLLEAGYGRVGAGWRVDGSLQPWRVGRPLADIFASAGAHDESATEDGDVCSLTSALDAPVGLVGLRRVQIGAHLFDVLGGSGS